MLNVLMVSGKTLKKSLEYYFTEFKDKKEDLIMQELVEAIYVLFENPEKKINELSVMISQDEKFKHVFKVYCFYSNYGELSREQFVQKIVDSIRSVKPKEWSNFSQVILDKNIKSDMYSPYQKVC